MSCNLNSYTAERAIVYAMHDLKVLTGATSVSRSYVGDYVSITLAYDRKYCSVGIPGWGGYQSAAEIWLAVRPDGTVRVQAYDMFRNISARTETTWEALTGSPLPAGGPLVLA